MEPQVWVWLGLMVVFIIFEIATTSLTTIWFAGGAFVAFVMSIFSAPLWAEITAFFVVSLVLLIFTRPVVTKLLKIGQSKTNVESLIGQKAKVLTEINNNEESGTALINGQEWTARACKDDEVFAAGDIVEVEKISGVKLIVKKSER